MHGNVKEMPAVFKGQDVRDKPAQKYVFAESKGTHNMHGDVKKCLP